MSIIARNIGRRRSRRTSAVRSLELGLESLEGRPMLALLYSVAFDLKGQEVADYLVTFPGSFTGEYTKNYTSNYVKNGPTPYLTGVVVLGNQLSHFRSVSTAFGKGGSIIQDVVDSSGNATQYISYANGRYATIQLGSGVESMSVAFQPDGTGVTDVVYEDGSYYEFVAGGSATQIATGVVSASVAIDSKGDKLQDYVTADGTLHEISGTTTTTLGTNVVSSGVAFDGNDGVVRAVVFTDGTAYKYDYAGAHKSPQKLFTPTTQLYLGSTGLAFAPDGDEYALVTYSDYELYQFNSSGAALLSRFGGVISANTAFSPAGKIIQDYVAADGTALESINGSQGTIVGTGVQSISIAFDPGGNEVADVVYMDGDYYEFDSSGNSTKIATGVVSASVAIDKSGDKLQDYVTTDGVAHEIKGGTTTTLGTNVVSISVAFDGNGGIARSVLFTNGNAYQYDYAGQHLQGQVFDPFAVDLTRVAFTAKLPPIPVDYGSA